jgi:hypothetical protein
MLFFLFIILSVRKEGITLDC